MIIELRTSVSSAVGEGVELIEAIDGEAYGIILEKSGPKSDLDDDSGMRIIVARASDPSDRRGLLLLLDRTGDLDLLLERPRC